MRKASKKPFFWLSLHARNLKSSFLERKMLTDEKITKKKKFAGEKKTSMHRRDDHHDYTERRMYMITIEVEGRRPVFGHLTGDPFAAAGSGNEARLVLSELGEAVQHEWMAIHGYYPQIEVMGVQMMPDHMHGILFVKAPLPVHLGQVISGFKAGCRKAERALREKKEAAGMAAGMAGMAAAQPLPTEKAGPQANCQGTKSLLSAQQGQGENSLLTAQQGQGAKSLLSAQQGQGENSLLSSQQAAAVPLQPPTYRPLFAKGYNDLILRSYDELPTWLNYLHDNPRRLMLKRARPAFLRPFFNLPIGTHTYNGIGNRQLLAAPRRLAVRLSRRLTESDIEREIARHLAAAKAGTVLVSPAISPAEKRVMRAVFDAGYPTIVLMENGFTPLSKPHGEQFYACAKGTLLMLSPWEHHNDKRKLTATQCQQLNLMALEISNSQP